MSLLTSASCKVCLCNTSLGLLALHRLVCSFPPYSGSTWWRSWNPSLLVSPNRQYRICKYSSNSNLWLRLCWSTSDRLGTCTYRSVARLSQLGSSHERWLPSCSFSFGSELCSAVSHLGTHWISWLSVFLFRAPSCWWALGSLGLLGCVNQVCCFWPSTPDCLRKHYSCFVSRWWSHFRCLALTDYQSHLNLISNGNFIFFLFGRWQHVTWLLSFSLKVLGRAYLWYLCSVGVQLG